MTESITVLGKEIPYQIKDVDIDTLEYYRENPRINYIISRNPPKKVTQDFIEQELLKLPATKDRIHDLEENKGLLDEVYVVGNKVVEGNTRLCAYRRLRKKYPSDPRWDKIKARILLCEVSDEDLFYILGTFHLKGKTEWDAYEKAAYIHKMIKELNKNPADVGKQLNKYGKSIEAMLKAYEAMSKKYLKNSSGEALLESSREDLKKYSYFEAFFLQKELARKAQETPAFLDQFVDWVREDRFKNAQSVRDLPKILSHKKAFRAFVDSEPEQAFSEARQVLYEHRPEKVDRFYKKTREFREMLGQAEITRVKEEIEANRNKKAEIESCYKDLRKFCKALGLTT